MNPSVYRLIAIRKICWNICTILHPLLDSPLDVPRYGLALLLCQRCHDCRDHLTGYLTGVNTLFLELNTDTEFFEFSDSRKAILCISGEPGDALDQNAVDFSFPAILHHALKIFALFNRRAGDALIGVNIDHFPIRIAGDQFRIVLILHAVGIELILAGGADAGIGRDAQFSCDEFIVCRDDYDTLLFQRKVSVGLLFRHILTSLQQHTLPHQGRNSYNQNGEKSSAKCEICTKLDSDPPRDLFDFILRKTDRSERFQELADA